MDPTGTRGTTFLEQPLPYCTYTCNSVLKHYAYISSNFISPKYNKSFTICQYPSYLNNKIYRISIYNYSKFFYIMNMNERIDNIKHFIGLGIINIVCRICNIHYLHVIKS